MQQVLVIILLLLFIAYAALIMYYRLAWKRLPYYTPVTSQNFTTKISVIIPARNEAANIGACIDALIQQSYPKNLFEVLVVDDFSTDNTPAVVSGYSPQNVKLVMLKDFVSDEINSYKKKAIEMAIQQSTGDLIVTTDADCIARQNWLQTIAAFYEEKQPAFIAMPVSINCRNRFVEIFQSLDFMTLQGITGAALYKKSLSMCNGANMAYTKKAFTEVNSFSGIDDIASGDDMLLMHKIYKNNPDSIFFLKSREVIVQTLPVKTIGQFFNQRIRWASKAGKYDDKRITAVLLLVYLFNLSLLALPVIALFKNIESHFVIYPFTFHFSLLEFWCFLLLSKTVIELFFLFPVAGFFNKKILLWWFPLLQPFHILYTVIAGWLGKFGSYTWKDRSVK
jgi:cellulose synthase/poly-beta-1,6-N-acetylglucosamine synthase-like glycosyltransferase